MRHRDCHTIDGHAGRLRARARDERGEGVISTGIAVLIMALLGATLWFVFSQVIGDAGQVVEDNTKCIATNTCEDNVGGGGTGG